MLAGAGLGTWLDLAGDLGHVATSLTLLMSSYMLKLSCYMKTAMLSFVPENMTWPTIFYKYWVTGWHNTA